MDALAAFRSAELDAHAIRLKVIGDEFGRRAYDIGYGDRSRYIADRERARFFRGASFRMECAAAAMRNGARAVAVQEIRMANAWVLHTFRDPDDCIGCLGDGIIVSLGGRVIRCPCISDSAMKRAGNLLLDAMEFDEA